MNYSIEVGNGNPKLVIRAGALGTTVMSISLESVGQIDQMTKLLKIARDNFPEAPKASRPSPMFDE